MSAMLFLVRSFF